MLCSVCTEQYMAGDGAMTPCTFPAFMIYTIQRVLMPA